MTDLFAPLQSLKEGHWFKLICGASFQYLPAVRSLTLAYTLAGADCIDLAPDPAVIAAAQEGLQVARHLVKDAKERGYGYKGNLPFLMVSLNDGEDPHFRKAEFNSTKCPTHCSRPCEKICPAQAIIFNRIDNFSGVEAQKCYGCGRCIPICPYDNIYTESHISSAGAVAPLVMSRVVDAVEIHTKIGHLAEFQQLWQSISPWADQLKVLAISCPDGEGMIDYLQAIAELITPLRGSLIWQTDGRPMSGDIGNGTTLATVKLGQKVLTAKLPGYVQLAGGTNRYTVAKLKAMGLLKSSKYHSQSYVSGVAYGSYARVLLSPILDQLENQEVSQTSVKAKVRLEEEPELLWPAVKLAHSLVSQIKSQQER
ncbi:circadian clock protein LdpA [Umezakia ovalisporum]|uniref:4Fe-4S ferredoxin n=1 Tax=Umezakia ovalisporum FSS-62 TaxID=2971776 RepID=A0AA43KEX9_9CYAN|nr:LdpA C-terminal domain-containing domain [Umezakia ovalisporum]MBI1242866.1 4Fe-4S ferredoxin [Nostoc sp. RI_552]MDH6064092.1 4Fe-4S ferredoxin [Umezakia ovalisporum FSS-62]MDH6065729.1 4Fe-4S ferredoxin [Umezakia ovalisporum APH033B]MDH6074713.1 4Fe-4S ferredoxin [Umezakia ovalisporum CS-1034]MDH6078354.1 4Fe-4S ferredoxin [Umezakia ovalisporum FSS-45]